MLHDAYIDASGKGDDQIFVMAGYVANVARWAKFAKEWARIIEGSGPPHYRKLDYFKMSEMQSQADLERCGWFYRIIEDWVQVAISVVISIPDLHRVIDEYPWPNDFNPSRLKTPYYLAFKTIIGRLAEKQIELGESQPVDFVFDNDSEKGAIMDVWESMRSTYAPNVQELMGDPPIFRDDKTVMPLQAADLWAYWVRKWSLEGKILDPIKELNFPWPVRRNMPRMNATFLYSGLKQAFGPVAEAAMEEWKEWKQLQ